MKKYTSCLLQNTSSHNWYLDFKGKKKSGFGMFNSVSVSDY